MDSQPFRRISVVIANYNYGRFLAAAIDSALALDWPDVEVVVVDDGSTDDSRDVMQRYGSRITAVYQENASQRVARNRGFELSTGDVVVHLDSDDVLRPGLGRAVAGVWRPGVSKVQVQMERIDGDGRPTGGVLPRYRRTPSPDDVRRWVLQTGAYPTPPGSGNVYARWFLECIFPLDASCGPATDSACLAAAPFLGDVVTVAEPLVAYRVHGSNTSTLTRSPHTYGAAVERALQRHAFGRAWGGLQPVDTRSLRRSRHLLQLRIASRRLSPTTHPLAGDTIGRLLLDAVRSPLHPGPESPLFRAAVMLWSVVTVVAPGRVARRLVDARFGSGPGGRPSLVPKITGGSFGG